MERIRVFLTDVRISPDGELFIYGQKAEDEKEITAMMNKLRESIPESRTCRDIQIGDLCVAKFSEDDDWYRAEVRDKAGDLWMLEFIDYGNVQATNLEHMRSMSGQFLTTKPYAQSYLLQLNAAPVGSAGLWTTRVTDVIQNEFLYSEAEIEVSEAKSCCPTAKCDVIKEALFQKQLITAEKMYPLSAFPVNSHFQAFLSNCCGSEQFYMQAKNSGNDLDKLMDEMASFYSTDNDNLQKLLLPQEDVKSGMLVASVYSVDGGFYRGHVRSVHGGKCTVHYIDYGDSEEKSIQCLYSLPDQFCKLDHQAIACKLHGVSFPESVKAHVITDAINSFAIEKTLKVTVKQHEPPHCLVVDVENEETQSFLAKHLVEKKCAVLNNIPVDANNMEEQMLQYLKVTTGERLNVVVTCIEDDGSFHCYSTVNEDLLNRQLDTLYEVCCNPDADCLKNKVEKAICCAPYSADGNWYRAEIVKTAGDEAVVRFVDYGNTSTCPIASLLHLPDNLRKLPIQALHCALSSQLKGQDLIDTLNSVKDEEVVIEVVNMDEKPYVVRMYREDKIIGIVTKEGEWKGKTIGTDMMYKKRVVMLGSRKEVLLTQTADLKSLWCILQETSKDLQKLVEEVNEIYGASDESYNSTPEHCEADLPCVVHDPKDGLWYRSKILKPAGEDKYAVLYVDYGRCEVVPKAAIKLICSDLLKLPVFGVRFILTGLKSNSGADVPMDQCQSLLRAARERIFIAGFKSYDASKDVHFLELHDAAGHFCLTPRPANAIHSLPALKVDENIELPIRITSVDGPDCIWVQLLDHNADLLRLTSKMSECYDSVPEQALTLDNDEYGTICCLKSTQNKNWCRGLIVSSYDGTIDVKFLDFGYEESAYLKDAKILLPEFCMLPALAVRCSVDNIRPSGSRWTNASARFLKDFVRIHGTTAEFLEHKATYYSVSMYVTSSKGEKQFISKRMVDQGLAAWIDIDAAASALEKLKNNKPLQQTAGQVDVHDAGKINTLATPRLFYHQAGISLIGAEIPARVTDPACPSDFFLLPRNPEARNTYDQLFKELNSRYSAESPPITQTYIGMPCVYVCDGVCYRAAIVGEEDASSPSVFLVDYGEKKKVPVNSLKTINVKHVTCLTPISIRCTLHGIVEPKSPFWSSKAMLSFSKYCKNNQKDMVCFVHGCVSDGVSQFFMVELSTPFVNVVDLLVNEGNCQRTVPMGKLQPPFSSRSFVYSNLGMGIGKEDRFYVTHIVRPDLFYCQLGSRFGDIDALMDKLQEYCTETPTGMVAVKDLKFSPTCFAKYDDGKWYRAHYDAPCPNSPNHVSVVLVDFGNTITIPLSNVIRCRSSSGLADTPIQALPCCLSEITVPVKDAAKSAHYLQEMERNLSNRQLPGVITGCTNGRFHLDLFADERRVNDIVTGIGSPCAAGEQRSRIRDCDPRLREKFKEMNSVENKSVHSVIVCEATDPDHFHVRLASYNDQYETCMNEVDGYYTAVRYGDYIVTVLENGNVVCAKHPTTFHWCRGLVIDTDSRGPTHALIEFVDLGERWFVSLEDNIKKLVSDMLIWPRFTIKCNLANVKPCGDSWSPECAKFFSQLCLDEECRVRFNTKDVTQDRWTIDMKINRQNVSHMLVEKKFAEFRNAPSSTASSGVSVSAKTRKMDVWAVGTKKHVYVSHVESADEVYLQMVESEGALNSLMDKLNSPALKLERINPAHVLSGRSYVAKYEDDGQWYRANILTQDKATKSFTVIFADYGNLSHIKLEDLRLLPKALAELPEQVIKCKISLALGTDKNAATEKLEELAAMDDISVYAKSMGFDSGSLTMTVSLSVEPPEKLPACLNLDKVPAPEAVQENKAEMKPAYSEPTIATGVSTKVYVSQVDAADKIWVQLSSTAQDLEKLMADVESYFTIDRSVTLKAKELYAGMPCAAKYSADNAWYRACVVKMEGTKPLVHFMDYGNAETIDVSDLRNVDEKFLALPAQAVLCSLKDVSNCLWTDKDTDDFVTQVSDIELDAVFYKRSAVAASHSLPNTTSYDVNLALPDGKSLNAEWKKLLENRGNPSGDGSGDQRSEVVEEKADLKLPEKHIVSDRGDHVIVENLNLHAVNLDFNASIDVSKTPTGPPDVTLHSITVEPKQKEAGYVSHCENPGDFFVQFACLASTLDEIYKGASIAPVIPVSKIEPEKYCIAKSPDDDEWYRAKCVKCDENVEVLFIDYGNVGVVKFPDIKPMPDALMQVPVQAVRCRLHGVEPLGASWASETDFFLDSTLDKDLEIIFVEQLSDGVWSVNLVVDGVDVGAKMVEEKQGKLHVKTNDESAAQNVTTPWSVIRPGDMHCVKVVHVIDAMNFSVCLVNTPTQMVADEMAEFVSGDMNEKKLLDLGDLQCGGLYLMKTSEDENWLCVQVLYISQEQITVISLPGKTTHEISTKGLKIMQTPKSLSELAHGFCISCSLKDHTGVSDFKACFLGKLAVGSFLEKDASGKWCVKLYPFESHEYEASESVAISDTINKHETSVPDITITDEDGNLLKCEDDASPEWLERNKTLLTGHLNKITEILTGCPAALWPFSAKVSEALLLFEKAANVEQKVPAAAHKRQPEQSPEKAQLGKSPSKKARLEDEETLVSNSLGASEGESILEWSFECGDSFEALVVEVDNPGAFFVRPFLVLQEHSTFVNETSEVRDSRAETTRMAIGAQCFAKFSDTVSQIQHWVRAVVRGYEGEKYLLRDADTNILFNAPQDCAIPLNEETEMFDRLCLKARLHGVVPKNHKDAEEWSAEATELFKSMVHVGYQENSVMLEIVSVVYDEDSGNKQYDVDITVNRKSVAEKLIHAGFALKLTTPDGSQDGDEEKSNLLSSLVEKQGARKPFANLTEIAAEMGAQSGRRSASYTDLAKCLLAVPWPMIRSSSGVAEDESDSVFVYDLDSASVTPLATSTGNVVTVPKRPFKSFQIYCSTSSPFVPGNELSTGMQNDTDVGQVTEGQATTTLDTDSAYVPCTPIEPPTPSDDQDGIANVLPSLVQNEAKESKLTKIAKLVIEEVFHSIELEEETGCSLPDSLYDATQEEHVPSGKSVIPSVFRKLSSVEILRGEPSEADTPGAEGASLLEEPSLDAVECMLDGGSLVFADPEVDDMEVEESEDPDLQEIPAPDAPVSRYGLDLPSVLSKVATDEPVLDELLESGVDASLTHSLNEQDAQMQEMPTMEEKKDHLSTVHPVEDAHLCEITPPVDVVVSCGLSQTSATVEDEIENGQHLVQETQEDSSSLEDRSTVEQDDGKDSGEVAQVDLGDDHLQEIPTPEEFLTPRDIKIYILDDGSSKDIMTKDVYELAHGTDYNDGSHDLLSPQEMSAGISAGDELSVEIPAHEHQMSASDTDLPDSSDRFKSKTADTEAHAVGQLNIKGEDEYVEQDHGYLLKIQSLNQEAAMRAEEVDDLEAQGESLVEIPQPEIEVGESPFPQAMADKEVTEQATHQSLDPYGMVQGAVLKSTDESYTSLYDDVDEDCNMKNANPLMQDTLGRDQEDAGCSGSALMHPGCSDVASEAAAEDVGRDQLRKIDEESVDDDYESCHDEGFTPRKQDLADESTVVEEDVSSYSKFFGAILTHEPNLILEISPDQEEGDEDLTEEEAVDEDETNNVPDLVVEISAEREEEEDEDQDETARRPDRTTDSGSKTSGDNDSREGMQLESSTDLSETETSFVTANADDSSVISVSPSKEPEVKVFTGVIPTVVVEYEGEEVERSCACNTHKYVCCLPPLRLEPGDSFEVSYMDSEDPNEIQLQFNMGQDSDEWEEAMREMNTTSSISCLKEMDDWQPDMLCVVRCESDMSWDRGKIYNSISDGEFLVELLDYGDMVTATAEQLREMPDSVSLYPPQTIRCALGNVAPFSGADESTGHEWHPLVNEYLKKSLFCASLRVEIMKDYDGATAKPCVIRLYLLDGNEEEDLGEMLIASNLAQAAGSLHAEDTDKEWSTMTDSAWETVLHPNISSSDMLHSSNVDLSNSAEFGGVEEINKPAVQKIKATSDSEAPGGDASDSEAHEDVDSDCVTVIAGVKYTEEELDSVADELLRTVFANAVAIVSGR